MALRTSLVAQPHLYMGDTQGRPLDAGKVYFGEPNKDPELYPINVFYDEALTIAAPQPIRTQGGFMNASGQMVEIYAAETEYSVKVLDGYGRQVFYQTEMSSTSTSGSVSTKLPYPTAVTRTLSEKNSDKVSFLDMGANGDGVTDDTAAIFTTLSNTDIKEVDGLNKEYRITSAQLFERGNIKVKNTAFLVSGLTASQFAMEFKGSQGNDIALTADANITDVTVANASGFSIDDFVYISSSKEWSSAPFPVVKCGEIAQIKEISGNKLTLKGELGAYHKVVDGAKVAKLNLLKSVKFENVKFINTDDTRGLNEGAIKLSLCASSYLDVESRNFDYAHVALNRCAYTYIKDSDISGCKGIAGTDYGVVIADGCYSVEVLDSRGSDLRHFVSVGNTSAGGGVSRYIKVDNCHVTDMHDAYFDSHVGCMEFSVNNCTGSSGLIAVSNQDGVSVQNANARITNCNFEGIGRHGLAYTNQVNEGVYRKPHVVISSNNSYQGSNSNAAAAAILVMSAEAVGRAAISLASSSNDKAQGFGFHLFANARKAVIDKITISSPDTLLPMATRAIEIRASESDVGLVNITGGVLGTSSTNDVILFNGASAAAKVKQWSISGSTLVGNGATTAVRARFTDNGVDGGVQIINCATKFSLTQSNAAVTSKTDIAYSTSWAGGTINAGASVGFAINSEANFGDLVSATIDVATQGCDVFSRVDTAGQIRVEIANRTTSNRTFGAMKIKAVLNKNI
ncbi:hypothetical protein ACS8E2_05655 [Psychrobacter glaciei]|uniref:hypothetical protein n=1 Tax=Psychrobacter glaciei TaxID=619771 RepID=UPI003F45EF75